MFVGTVVLQQRSSTVLLGTHSPGKFTSNRLQHTCLQFSSSLEELDRLLQVCLIRVVAKLFRIVGPQDPVIYSYYSFSTNTKAIPGLL